MGPVGSYCIDRSNYRRYNKTGYPLTCIGHLYMVRFMKGRMHDQKTRKLTDILDGRKVGAKLGVFGELQAVFIYTFGSSVITRP